MLAGSWGAVTLQRCSIPQGCGPWGLPRGRTCPGEWAVVAPPPPAPGCRTLRGAWTGSLVGDGAPSRALLLMLCRPPAEGPELAGPTHQTGHIKHPRPPGVAGTGLRVFERLR